MSDPIADAIIGYLNDAGHRDHRGCLVVEGPLPREFRVRLARWWPLLVRLEREAQREYARSALCDLQGARCVGRALLRDWARDVADDPSDRNLIRLWVAVRVWGGLGRFGARNVRLGLDDANLIHNLRSSASAIRHAPTDLSSYGSFRVSGTRLSYASKWFWAVSLARDEMEVRPLILDDRVRAALRLVASRCGEHWTEPTDMAGYLQYVKLLHEVAPTVEQAGHPHVDAEKVEWLLFDRRPYRGRGRRYHEWTKEHCLVDWLPGWTRRPSGD